MTETQLNKYKKKLQDVGMSDNDIKEMSETLTKIIENETKENPEGFKEALNMISIQT